MSSAMRVGADIGQGKGGKMAEFIFEIDGAQYNEDTGEVAVKAKAKEELVRCKECRYWERQEPYATIGKCSIWKSGRRSTDFCSEGRKKEDG